MSNVKFNKNTFEKEIGKLTEEMQEKIALFGCPVENIDAEDIELEIFPNRPDLLSYQGFKRSFLAFLGKRTGYKKYQLNKPEKDYEVIVDASVKEVRPYTACAIVRGLKLDDEKIKDIINIQEKLHITLGRKRKKLAIGVYPLEKINLPIHYKALEPDKIRFQPLESPREMSGLEILQRHPTGKEYAFLLAGKVKFPVFMDSKENILSMPPIINSESTGRVTEKTKDVFVECSGFDFLVLEKCLNIIVTTLADMGGKIYQMKVKDKIIPSLETEKMKLSLENTNKILGLELNEKQIKQSLEKMGYNFDKGLVEIPPYRTDILHEIDLIEDIAVGYGYENFVPEIPMIATIGKENPAETVKRKIAEVLIGLGLLEVSNYHLTKKDDLFSKMGINEKEEKGFIELLDSKTDYTVLRKDLTHYIIKIMSENVDSEYPQKIFELGRVFNLENSEIIETERLSVGVSPGNFTDVKQVLDYLGENLGIKFRVVEQKKVDSHFIVGRAGDVFLDDKKIGTIGEIHPKILKNWKVKMPISLFEIELKEIFEKF
ncbi:phenylalanine--tRNA ligase subunit beta [archaeon]|nr:phenylalanine--tRNA ligase subunit beta [archaeon]